MDKPKVDKSWAQWTAKEHQKAIRQAERQLQLGDVEDAKRVLSQLAANGEPAAMTLMSQISREDEPEAAYLERQRKFLEAAAAMDFPPALYLLGYYYDEGEFGFPIEKPHAAQLFKAAAEKGHVHSQWIYGLDLLHGTNGIEKDENLGRQFLMRAFDAGLQRALESVASFHRRGAFGFEKDEATADAIEARASSAQSWI